MTDKREELAEYAHEAWSGWMKHMFKMGMFMDGVWVMPKILVERWHRQMNTPYDDLTETEKDSDRAEADKMLEIMRGQNENQNNI